MRSSILAKSHTTYRSIYTLTSILLIGCKAPHLVSTPIEAIDKLPLKTTALSKENLKSWHHKDLVVDTIPGMSVERAYKELLFDKHPVSTVVAVIDSGVDIEHEDLKSSIWVNEDEIPNNNLDDDQNGYIDDVHGWNFLGEITYENLELTRIVRKYATVFDGKELKDINANQQENFVLYVRAKNELVKEKQRFLGYKERLVQMYEKISQSHNVVTKALGTDKYTLVQLKAYTPQDEVSKGHKQLLLNQQDNLDKDESIVDLLKTIKDQEKYAQDQLDYYYNLGFSARDILNDDADDFSKKSYGDAKVQGHTPDKEGSKHGTHVSGIIAATRNNGLGGNGIADMAKIMAVRAVPDGDEYDKDVALAIRYAVDNGAKVINTSFGKYYSEHSDWVRDAIVYAAQKDVLIVNAAGNDAANIDAKQVYPNDQTEVIQEVADNFITVGALNYEYGTSLVANFSNYGKNNVDIFAPGVKIYAPTPNDTYDFLSGTSMATPSVSGIAAVIRSYYPKLKAKQVKEIILASGIALENVVMIGEDQRIDTFKHLSKSGKIVNLYEAIKLAERY